MIDSEDHAIHDRHVATVADAVAKLALRFAPYGLTPEVVLEGAVRGGALSLLAGSNATAPDIADLLETIAEAVRHLDQPKLRVVS